ncbi:lipocalin family protein [Diaphorobacter ruginosibacter]|nr:lipocalin family protein [Diaphorobacter ruginosibacter]
MNLIARRLFPLASRSLAMAAAGSAALWFFGERVKVPAGVTPQRDFDIVRYMGHWYEIARLEQRFERGLTSTSADYTLQDDGTVQVVNRGYNPETGSWEEARAVARMAGDPTVGALKVSFFRPFYGGYNVVHVDDDYETAVVVGDGTQYFWILARSPDVGERRYEELLEIARRNGVQTEKVVRIPQGASFAQPAHAEQE